MELLRNVRSRSVALTSSGYTQVVPANRGLKLVKIQNDSGADVWLHTGWPPWCLEFAAASSQHATCDGILTAELLAATTGAVKMEFMVTSVAANRALFAVTHATTMATAYLAAFIDTSAKLNVMLYSGGACQWMLTTTTAVPLSTWLKLKIVHNGTTPRVYLNGEEWAVTFGVSTLLTPWFAALSTATVARIGCAKAGSAAESWFMEGRIRMFQVWDRLAVGLTPATDRVCRALYFVNEGTGTTLTDVSGIGNNATLVNAPTWRMGADGEKIGDEWALLYDIAVPTTGIYAYTTAVGASLSVLEAW